VDLIGSSEDSKFEITFGSFVYRFGSIAYRVGYERGIITMHSI